MITVSAIPLGDAEATRRLLAATVGAAVSTGAYAAISGARRAGDLEAWTFQRIEDVESLLALLEGCRRHGTVAQDIVHSIDRLIAKLRVASRS
jgi:hypothetical protein